MKKKQNPAEKETVTAVFEVKKKSGSSYAAIAVIVAIAVIAIVFLVNAHSKNRELAAELKAAEDEVERQKELYLDLEAHANGLEIENGSLVAQLEEAAQELLNIREKEPVITSAQLEEQLSAISELVTQKYMYTNADKAAQRNTWIFGWDMPFSEKSFIVKYDGVIKAGIDLKDVQIDVNEDNHKVTVTLPASEITDNNVPQETVETFGIKDGLFNKVAPDDPNNLIIEGKKTMEAKAIERGLLAEADKEAEVTIRAFLALVPGMGTTYELEVKHR